MRLRSTRLATGLGLGLALTAAASAVSAQSAAPLSEARQAYVAVDYARTRELAQAALERGGNDRAATAELYLLWATAAAALDQPEEARGAFSRALAVNPDLRLDRGLSPKIRAPYQEARGALSGADGRAPLTISLARRGAHLELQLRDTQSLCASVELITRAHLGQPFIRQRFRAAPARRVSAPNDAELEYALQLLDAHDNVLLELGSESDPRRLPASAGSAPELAPRTAAAVESDGRAPYHITAVTLAALGLAAGGVSTAWLLRREDAARDWNGPGCEKPGQTREQQCAAVDDRRRQAERWSMGFAAAGGTLLVGSLITWIMTPAAPARASLALDTTRDSVMLRLRAPL